MNKTIRILDLASFSTAFGAIGLKVGTRIGPNRRSQEDKEWFVIRRFLEVALREQFFSTPFLVQRRNPPEPDFALTSYKNDFLAYVEITEATCRSDQRERTEFERSKKSAMLLGDFGGRFSCGASQPGRAWASDILDAIKRKQRKAIFLQSDVKRHLVIYPNSNASILLDDIRDDDEVTAFGYLAEAVGIDRGTYIRVANGCFVHVLGNRFLGLDILGERRLSRR